MSFSMSMYHASLRGGYAFMCLQPSFLGMLWFLVNTWCLARINAADQKETAMNLIGSPSPETVDLFRSSYCLPRVTLWLLLFVVFPSIDPSVHLPTPTPSTPPIPPLPTSISSLATSTPTPTSTDPLLHPSCPDAYLDHRNNLICPHAPKRLKSVRQRCSQVLLEFKISVLRSLSASSPTLSPSTQTCPKHHDHHPQLISPIHHLNPSVLISASIPRVILCAPLSNPFLLLIIILHTLLVIQALSLLVEDALIKDACYSHQSLSFRKSSSWPKIWSRFQFRFRKQWSQRAFLEPFLVWVSAIALLILITRETIGETDSWSTGLIWHDLPFRNRCRPPPPDLNQKKTISLITSPNLRFLRFLLDRPPFLKPARSLIILECILTFICLLQPAQHILPSRILPRSIKIPQRILNFRSRKQSISKLRSDYPHHHLHLNHNHQNLDNFNNNNHYLFNNNLLFSSNPDFSHFNPTPVEVETKWLLGVLVEAFLCLTSILAYLIVMVHLPYASHYSIAFFLTIYSIKSTCRKMKKLMSTSMNTINCLQVVLMEFSERRRVKNKQKERNGNGFKSRRRREISEDDKTSQETVNVVESDDSNDDDWTCSICFEDSEDRSDSSLSSTDPTHQHHSLSTRQNSDSDSSPKQEQEELLRSRSKRRKKKRKTASLSNRCILNCHHSYHTTCLVKWLHYQSFCPICHREVL